MKGPIISTQGGGNASLRLLPGPTLRISTARLVELGFVPDAVVTVAAEPGAVTFTLREGGRELVRFARANKMQLIQVQRHDRRILMEISGRLIEKAGLTEGDEITALCWRGLIQVRKLLS